MQWEESKKWQKKVDSLKTKLADSNKEIEVLQKQAKSLKDIIERFINMQLLYQLITIRMSCCRSDREKSYLHKKLQSIQKYPATRTKTSTVDNSDAGMHQTEQLKRKIHELEEEVRVCVTYVTPLVINVMLTHVGSKVKAYQCY